MAAISAGSTQTSAVFVTESATPTTVIVRLPTAMVVPSWLGALPVSETTAWSSPAAQ